MTIRCAWLMIGAVLTCCRPEDPAAFAPPAEVGRLRVINASPDTAQDTLRVRMDARVDGVVIAVNLAYRGAAGYFTALPGARQLLVRRTKDTTVVFLQAPVTVAANTDYTVLATGLAPDLSGLVVTDDNTAPTADDAKLRLINASPTMGGADVYVTSPTANLAVEAPDVPNLVFRAASAYFTLPAGAYRVRFTTPGTQTVLLDVTGTALPALVRGQIRTVVALDRARGGTPLTSVVLADR